MQAGYNDNIYLRPANVVGSAISVISPYVKLELKTGGNVFDLQYRSDFTRYHDAPADSYANHLLQANAQIRFDARNDLRLRAEERAGVDPRGSTDRFIAASPDEWRQTNLFAMYGYGARGNPGRLEFDGSWTSRRYINNRLSTAVADRDTTDLGATFFWRIAPKTRVFIQARHALIDYALDTSTQSSTETRYYVGAQWEATAKTSGYAKVGWMEKRFNSGGSRAESGASWDLGVRWSPLSYSVVDVTAQRTFVESTGVGDAVINSRTTVGWTHAWSSRFNHNLYWWKANDDFVGAGATRQDDTVTMGLRLSYRYQRWLSLGAQFSHTERDSNDALFRYRRNVLMFSVSGTL